MLLSSLFIIFLLKCITPCPSGESNQNKASTTSPKSPKSFTSRVLSGSPIESSSEYFSKTTWNPSSYRDSTAISSTKGIKVPLHFSNIFQYSCTDDSKALHSFMVRNSIESTCSCDICRSTDQHF